MEKSFYKINVLVLFLLNILFSVVISSNDEFEEVTVLSNSSVHLPCNPASEGNGAVAVIVLWYKSSSPEPFYSYDLRQHGGGRHWSDDTVFGRRAQFDSRRNPLGLTVESVRPSDEGIYRCRVDFERGPSKTFSIKLDVVVLPTVPVVTDENGVVVKGEAGPYLEGGRVVLTCKTIGGRPPPTLVWIRDGKIIEDSFNGDSRGQVRNLLHLENLSRDYLDVVFTCRASNNNITGPLDTSVKINITLKPLSVTLRRVDGPQNFVIADRIERLECIVVGSRPDPKITWWKNGDKIDHPVAEEEICPNITRSILRIKPKPFDLGVIITCRVENILLPNSVLEESYKLNVYYVPLVSLKMGLGLNPQSIREGSDVFMECNITANPKATGIIWMHESKEIKHNISDGIIISNQTLVLQQVSKERSGSYQCRGVNAQGKGTSKPILLNIMYAPFCISEAEAYYQVSRHSTSNISCEVDAQPKNVSFRWQFNNSGGITDIKTNLFTSKETRSVLSYTPKTTGDYGLLICTAENVIGAQEYPCIFNITAAKPPELLESCVIRNQSSHSVFVTCKNVPTELPTTYSMEVQTSEDGTLVTRVRNNTPAFVASGLAPGTAYILHISVKTPMGVSDPIELRAFTVKTAEKRMGITEKEEPESEDVISVTLVIIGSVVSTILLLLGVAIKCCTKRTPVVSKTLSKSPNESEEDVSTNASRKGTMSSGFSKHSPSSEERNPDLIPLASETDYQLEELRVPTSHHIMETTSQGSCKPMGSNLPLCYNVPVQALPQSVIMDQGLFYSLHSSLRRKNQLGMLRTRQQSLLTLPHQEGSPEACRGQPLSLDLETDISNVPPFLPPEEFREETLPNFNTQSTSKGVAKGREFTDASGRHESTV